MTSVELTLCALTLLGVLVGFFGIKRYRTPLNPLTIFAAVQIGLFTVLSAIVVINVGSSEAYTPADVIRTIFVAGVYLIAATLPYLFKRSFLSTLFGKVLSLFGLASEETIARFKPMKFVLLLIGAAIAFILLMVLGGGGMLLDHQHKGSIYVLPCRRRSIFCSHPMVAYICHVVLYLGH